MKLQLYTSKPYFIENSRIPIWLSYLAPINISAITLGPFVLSRTELSEQTKNHETIHWQQYIDCGIIGFPILYLLFWLYGLAKYRGDGSKAYHQIPFEQEAYDKDDLNFYFLYRKRYAWWNYKI